MRWSIMPWRVAVAALLGAAIAIAARTDCHVDHPVNAAMLGPKSVAVGAVANTRRQRDVQATASVTNDHPN